MFPTADAFVAAAKPHVDKWAKTVVLSIDPSERGHGLFRLKLRSAGQGRSGKTSGDAFVCSQAYSHHCNRGGRPLLGRSTAACLAMGTSQPKQQVAKGDGGGGPFVHFHNLKMSVFKAMRAPDRPLTDLEILDAEERIKKSWIKVRQSQEYRAWVNVSNSRQPGQPALVDGDAPAHQSTALAKPSPPQSVPFTPLWRTRTSRVGKDDDVKPQIVPVEQLKAAIQAGPTPRSDRQFVVEEPKPRPQAREGFGQLLGCPSNLFGSCTHELEAGAMRFHDDMHTYLNAWIRSMTEKQRKDATELALFTSSPDERGKCFHTFVFWWWPECRQ